MIMKIMMMMMMMMMMMVTIITIVIVFKEGTKRANVVLSWALN